MSGAGEIAATSGRIRLKIGLRDMGTLLGLLLIGVVFASLSDFFLTERNLVNILQQSSINACVAIGMTLVIISGGIDLSVGPTAALTAVVSASMIVGGYPVALAMVVALAIGMACGLGNGLLVAYGGLQPFIVTLGTLSLYRALALIYTGGNPILGVPGSFRTLFQTQVWIFPMPIVVVAVLGTLAWVLLAKTPLGEYILAVGGNEEASRVSGVPIARTKISAYVSSGALASLGALIRVARLGAAEPTLAELSEHVRGSLAGYKAPRSVDFEERLPRHPTGKLYKRLLRDPYWEGTGRTI